MLKLTLPGGTGDLFKYKTGAQFFTGPASEKKPAKLGLRSNQQYNHCDYSFGSREQWCSVPPVPVMLCMACDIGGSRLPHSSPATIAGSHICWSGGFSRIRKVSIVATECHGYKAVGYVLVGMSRWKTCRPGERYSGVSHHRHAEACGQAGT